MPVWRAAPVRGWCARSVRRLRQAFLQLAAGGERYARVVPLREPFDFLRRENLAVVAQRVLQRIDDVIADDLGRACIVEHGTKRFERSHRLPLFSERL